MTIIKHKRGSGVPSSNELEAGELAIDTLAAKLYTKIGNAIVEIGGGSGGGGGVEEAPEDGVQYARQDAAWEPVSASGGGAWEILERVDVEGADTAEIGGIGPIYDYAAYKVIFSSVYSSSQVKSLQMQFAVDGVAQTVSHGSTCFHGDSATSPPYGNGDDTTAARYIELASHKGTGTGFGVANFAGEIDIWIPDINQAGWGSWGNGARMHTLSAFTCANSSPKEYRHGGAFYLGSAGKTMPNITGLHFTAKTEASGAISPFAGGSIHLLGFKGGRD